jgi:hypothetical protein
VTVQARGRPRLAWSLWLATFGCCAAGLLATLALTRPLTLGVLAEGAAFALAFALGFATVGLVMTLRLPANPIGWLYAAAGLAWSWSIPFGPWIDRLVRDHRPLPPLAQLVAVVGDYGWAPAIALGVTLPALLLPDGRLRSHRWRVVVATSVAGATLAVVAGSLAPGRLESTPIDNPFGLPGPAGTIALVLTLPGWAGILPNATTFVIYPAMLCPPVAIAVAVLRYRLWDLDRLVSRTVTYALLTALLVLPYLLVLPAVTRLAGGAGNLAVAAATLAAVAAFAPLRRRVQGLVDRRFNRRRYDAERTVAGFAARLRGQVDLDALAAELLAVVDQTVQPTQASLWLRPQPSPRPQR